MDKIKRFIDIHIPIEGCTLRCEYCYITVHRKFDAHIKPFNYTPNQLRYALRKDRLGGTCLINMCAGGETLLAPEVTEYARQLLEEGHYVMIVTNGTVTKAFEVMAQWPKHLLERLFFKFSYHYEQLKQRGWLDRFFANVKRMKESGASYTLEVTPYDNLIPIVDEMIERAHAEGFATPHFTVARDERNMSVMSKLTSLSDVDYLKTWGKYGSSLFEFKFNIFQQRRREFCQAGNWVGFLNLETGLLSTCHDCQLPAVNILKNPDAPIPLKPVGHNCESSHCWNGHVWLPLGAIPSLKTPTYAHLRNRINPDGSEWLQPKMKAFMSTRLYDSNPKLSRMQMAKVDLSTPRRFYLRYLRALRSLVVGGK